MNDTDSGFKGLPTERDAGPFNPHSRMSRLRDEKPLSRMTFPDGHRGWVVTGHEAARQLLADTRFSSRLDVGVHAPLAAPGGEEYGEFPVMPGMFVNDDPPQHTRYRGMLTGVFTVKRMKLLEEHIVELVERQLDALSRLRPPVDLVREFALPVPSLLISELLGVPYAERDRFQSLTSRGMALDTPLTERMEAFGELGGYLFELIGRKQADPGDDLLSDLIRREELTQEELSNIANLLLGAGHETTANVLALGTFALLEHPEQLAALRADPDLTPGAVEELMRFLSIADIGVRHAIEDAELAGRTIRAGTSVAVSLLTANHDPKRFDNPDTLDIRRNARGHLAFGHGIHQCLGQQLARLELRAGFDGLLRRFPSLRLAIPASEVRLRTDMQIYGVHELPVTWDGAAR